MRFKDLVIFSFLYCTARKFTRRFMPQHLQVRLRGLCQVVWFSRYRSYLLFGIFFLCCFSLQAAPLKGYFLFSDFQKCLAEKYPGFLDEKQKSVQKSIEAIQEIFASWEIKIKQESGVEDFFHLQGKNLEKTFSQMLQEKSIHLSLLEEEYLNKLKQLSGTENQNGIKKALSCQIYPASLVINLDYLSDNSLDIYTQVAEFFPKTLLFGLKKKKSSPLLAQMIKKELPDLPAWDLGQGSQNPFFIGKKLPLPEISEISVHNYLEILQKSPFYLFSLPSYQYLPKNSKIHPFLCDNLRQKLLSKPITQEDEIFIEVLFKNECFLVEDVKANLKMKDADLTFLFEFMKNHSLSSYPVYEVPITFAENPWGFYTTKRIVVVQP